MKVLIACEFSGIVRDAFRALGHDAWSLDVMPCERDPTYHIQMRLREGDAATEDILSRGWDLLGTHPHCTHLALSGSKHFWRKRKEQAEAVAFCKYLMSAPVPRIYLENPKSVLSTQMRKFDQVIQPWQFGHGEVKETWLWLKGLPKLVPTNIVSGRTARVHKTAPGITRKRERSRTFPGIAAAMAQQWGGQA